MYAAAGGASLASRQARQRQRQQKKTQQLQAKLHPPKAAGIVLAEHGASTPTRHSRQFHQLPNNYLRTPQAQARKLSASYTAQSKLLLPIDEGDTQSVLHMQMHSHAHGHYTGHPGHSHHAHSHAHQQGHQHMGSYTPDAQHTHHHQHGRVSPRLVHRHSGSSGTSFHYTHLPKSATATLPLVSQVEATPPTSPEGVAVAGDHLTGDTPPTMTGQEEASTTMALPCHDSIIVTPATPMASPGHVAKPRDELSDAAAEKQPLTAAIDSCDDDEHMQPPTGPLERKCSVYRMRRSDAFELDAAAASAVSGVKRQFKELQFNQQHQQYEPLLTDDPHIIFRGGRKVQLCAYCEEGICVCEHIECAQGRAAWLERGRRCSVQESQQQAAACHRRWVKRNRIQDASLGGSSDDEDFLGVLRGPSTFANAFLYVGLGTIALGLVIAFVGTGEKGFKTVELRLIGPSLIGLGFICCMLRILFCICPSHCISTKKNARKKNGNKIDADHTTSLLRGESKRVSIARGPGQQPRYPITHKRSNSKMLNEGMEALRQIATTSLFMQNEQKPMTNRIVPIIKEPENVNADANEATNDNKKPLETLSAMDMSQEQKANSSPKAAIDKELTTTNTAVFKAPLKETEVEEEEAKDCSVVVSASSGFSNNNNNNKLSRQRTAVHQPTTTSVHLLGQQNDSNQRQEMETSLMFIRNPKITNEMLSSPQPPLPTTTTSAATTTMDAAISSLNYSKADNSLIPPIHGPSSMAKSSLLTARPQTNGLTAATSSNTNTASTYAAALAAAISSRGNTERSEGLVRGPLGMPMHVLAASSSTYALPASAPSVCLVKTSTSAPLPAPSTAPSILSSTTTCDSNTSHHQQTIPGQVVQDVNTLCHTLTTTVPNTKATGSESNYSGTTLKFPATTMLSSTYSGSSSTLSPNSLIGSTSFTTPTTLPTTGSKYEPELLLSPAKLGQ
ncbi:uncharacterized protein LOC119607026 [Lucilia sericata]|uniref:uncharacterized protein LOC119607026 n=1 Tax=Lucilia sericata TaxID=13632 RepID=UPI0018A87F50|nr:uncharacterized protein LOC119607026 [Lucilia sericata]